MSKSSSYQPARIIQHFDEYGIREWERLITTPTDEVSLYIHTHYLRQYISPGEKVLEIGAGAGRFTQVLANLEAKILVADISPGQLELNKSFADQYRFKQSVENWQQVDICNLSRFASGTFDCVVAYGGLFSYVLDRRDVALAECMRVIRPGGRLLLSVMSLWGTAHRYLAGTLALPIATNRKITQSGDLSPITFPEREGSFMHLFRAAELRQWLTEMGGLVLKISASNCLSLRWEERLREIKQDENKWNELLRMELEACAEAGCLNMGTHIIAAVQKI